MDRQQENPPSREWLKFSILVGIMVVVVAVVALSRPFIFNRVLPSIVSVPAAAATPTPVPGETAVPTIEAEIEITGEPEVDPGINETIAETPAPTVSATAAATATETAVVIYVVQPGDNLTKIARRFGTTVDAIAAANQLANPNRLLVGTSLRIPQP